MTTRPSAVQRGSTATLSAKNASDKLLPDGDPPPKRETGEVQLLAGLHDLTGYLDKRIWLPQASDPQSAR